LVDILALPDSPYELAPLDADVAAAVELIDRNVVPDLPDRVIAATALARSAALASRDGKIRVSQVRVIW
jgi:predicted nucleic acid-binding protein